jgi:hypothetical protein
MAKQVTLVLLPGMDGTATLFAPFVQALGNRFKIISVCYPTDEALGYGDLTASDIADVCSQSTVFVFESQP